MSKGNRRVLFAGVVLLLIAGAIFFGSKSFLYTWDSMTACTLMFDCTDGNGIPHGPAILPWVFYAAMLCFARVAYEQFVRKRPD